MVLWTSRAWETQKAGLYSSEPLIPATVRHRRASRHFEKPLKYARTRGGARINTRTHCTHTQRLRWPAREGCRRTEIVRCWYMELDVQSRQRLYIKPRHRRRRGREDRSLGRGETRGMISLARGYVARSGSWRAAALQCVHIPICYLLTLDLWLSRPLMSELYSSVYVAASCCVYVVPRSRPRSIVSRVRERGYEERSRVCVSMVFPPRVRGARFSREGKLVYIWICVMGCEGKSISFEAASTY